jgi:uncharacterized membrane protein (DUF485 family)
VKIRANHARGSGKSKRDSLGWIMTALMMIVYCGYIALIVFTIVITAIYVGRQQGVRHSDTTDPRRGCQASQQLDRHRLAGGQACHQLPDG